MRRLAQLTIVLGLAALVVSAGASWFGSANRGGRDSSGGDGIPADDVSRAFHDLGYVSVPIERPHAGYSVVVASVGGRDVRLLLDTGSPFTCLDRKRTETLGLEWVEEPVPGQARDSIWDRHTSCEIRAMEFGAARAERVRAFGFHSRSLNYGFEAVGDKPVDGLLGADVLDAVGAVIDLKGGRLYVWPGSIVVPPIENRVWNARSRAAASARLDAAKQK
jgi:Aspartyl protease